MNKTKETLKMSTPVFDVVEKEFDSVPNFKPVGLNCKDWVMTVLIDRPLKEDPICLLVKQTRWGIEGKTIEFPCGTVEDSDFLDSDYPMVASIDDPKVKQSMVLGIKRHNAALRELEEETGIKLDSMTTWDKTLTFNPNPAYFNNTMTIFFKVVPDLVEKFADRGKQNLDADEDCLVFLGRFSNNYKKLERNAMSLAALYLMEE